MSAKYEAKRKLLGAALSCVASDMHAEDHPEDPHNDADAEYREDALLDAARNFVEVHDS